MTTAINDTIIIRDLGQQDYTTVWQEMRDYTDTRDSDAQDQIWLVEHPPVFTQGQAGKPEHILNAGDIPIVQSDRGGQVTYHGPGQIVVYVLLDVRRRKITVRQLVNALENAVINLLADYNIEAAARCDAPGVYVDSAKICSIGLRIRRGCSYHGIAFNADMDLEPFSRINPCGFSQMKMIQLRDLANEFDIDNVKSQLLEHIEQQLAAPN